MLDIKIYKTYNIIDNGYCNPCIYLGRVRDCVMSDTIITKFSIIIPVNDKTAVFINTLDGKQFVIDSDERDIIYRWRKTGISIKSDDEEQLFIQLKENGFIFESVEEEERKESEILERCRLEHELNVKNLNVVTLVLTYGCNFQCPYCYEKGEKEKSQDVMTVEMVDTIFAKYDHIDSIGLYGGEPLQPSTRRIVEYIVGKRPNDSYSITTNGYYLEEYIPLLRKIKIKEVMVTLDGQRDIHNATRVMPGEKAGTFDKIIKGIDSLLKNNIPVKIRMNISTHNIDSCIAQRDEMREKYTEKIDQNLLSLEMQAQFQLSYKEQDSLNNKLLYYNVGENKALSDADNTMSQKVSPFLSTLIRPQRFKPKYTGCSAEEYARFYDAEGYVYSCAIALGNKKAAIGKYFPDCKMKEYSFINRNIETVEECRKCILKFMCGGGCANGILGYYGDLNHPNCSYIQNEIKTTLPRLYNTLGL